MLINYLLFQIGWFACVLGGAHAMDWYGVTVALIVVVFHITTSPNKDAEVKLLITAMGIGIVFDAIPTQLGWIYFNDMPYWPSLLAPAWMLALWATLATTLNSSMAWLQPKPWLAVLLGAIAGPLAYLSGEKLGAMHIVQPTAAIIYLAIGWAGAMWGLVTLARHLKHAKTLGTQRG